MLERGHTIFDCQVVKLLVENDAYQSYLLHCSDSTPLKLFVLLPDPLFDQQRQVFLDHAAWLSSRSFPNVGSPIRADEVEGDAVCLYPFASGIPLAKILDEGCSVRQAVKLIKAIAECLSPPHRADICHGNLSPETIYVEGDTPYLADFSLSQLIRLDYKSGIDPQYTSPEQVRGDTPGTASDVYNLGCIFYHLLVGHPPFSGGDAFAIAKQHLQGEFPACPEELNLFQPLFDSLVKIEAEERITINEFINQITQLSSHQKIDHLHLSAPDDNVHQEEASSPDGLSLLDEAVGRSEIVARIEERLNAHAGLSQEFAADEQQTDQDRDTADKLDLSGAKNKIGFWRSIIILLLGVFIGSGLYFLFYKQSPVVSSVKVVPDVDVDFRAAIDLDKGLKLWREDDFNGAEAEFKRVINIQPDDPRAYNNLAVFYAAQGNYDQARDYLEQALATDEKYDTIYHNLGSVYAEMARGSYGRALQLDQKKALPSLPVFSSQGVSPVSGEIETQQELASKQELLAVEPSKPEPQIAKDEIISSGPSGIPDPVVQLKGVEGQGQTEAVSPEDDINIPTDEQWVIDETSQSVIATVKPEKGDSFLRRWAEAWSSQEVEDYLTFYADQFIPPGGRTRQVWEAQRQDRLAKPDNITVTLEDFKLRAQVNGNLTVEVIQNYKSDLLADRTQKIFDFKPTESGWKILRERSLGVIR